MEAFIRWSELARVVEQAGKTRVMTADDRRAYAAVLADLREPPLAGRKCESCQGPILQRPVDDKGTVTFDYDCTCPGHEPLDKSLPWEPVPPKPYEQAGGLHVDVDTRLSGENRHLVTALVEALVEVIQKANDHLFDAQVLDVEHQISSHPDSLPQTLRSVAAGNAAALEALQTVVRELVEPSGEGVIGLRGAFSEDLFHADGSPVTVEEARARAREAAAAESAAPTADGQAAAEGSP